jgi:hypothetical protein
MFYDDENVISLLRDVLQSFRLKGSTVSTLLQRGTCRSNRARMHPYVSFGRKIQANLFLFGGMFMVFFPRLL